MKAVSAVEFADWVHGSAVGFAPGATISSFALDTSEVKPGDLFLAIKGARVDGHDFVPQALAAGAVGALAERPVAGPQILVDNLVQALAKLATHFRAQYNGPVVAITGSAGKTTTKEFVASALSSLGSVLKTPGNRNSEYTSPLLWADLDSDVKAVVVEMAMRGFEQIEHLASFSKPTVGIVTNIGYAHLEMMGSRYGIADAKGELLEALPDDGAAVLWNEDDMLPWLERKTHSRIWTFGAEAEADCQITDYRILGWESSLVGGTCNGVKWEAKLPAAGRHIALNAAAAVMTASVLGVDAEQAAAHLEEAVLPPMRMEVLDLGGAIILLDNYNASPPSMVAAIETLSEMPVRGKRFAVIGEMRELGNYTENAHRTVGRTLAECVLDRVLFYGPATAAAATEAIANGMARSAISTAKSLEDVTAFLAEMQPGDAALVKGSRALELERALHREAH